MASEIESAIRQICEEKGLSYESVMETIESALAAAYRKDYGNKMQNIEVEFDPSTGSVRAFDVKTVVEDISREELERIEQEQAEAIAKREAARAAGEYIPREMEDAVPQEGAEKSFNPKTDIMISDARVLKMSAQLGDVLRTELPLAQEFGRMAAMTAKQVITQKLREAEREIVFNEYKEQEGEVVIGTVQRKEGRLVLVDIGRTTGIMLPEDQAPHEYYKSGDRIKVFVREVSLGSRGPQILLSRTSPELIRVLFELEIPEISDGTVLIKAMAREAGSRTKIAVASTDESIDPIGACIGQRGVRIQTIIQELGGEKLDVIEWNDNPIEFITASLSPAKVKRVELREEDQAAIAYVDEDQLSLAIGRGGQNVRLASRLSGWKLSVTDEKKVDDVEAVQDVEVVESKEEAKDVENVEETEESQEESAE